MPPPRSSLKPVALELLLVLLEGERHGYAIVKTVEAQTGLRIEPANLYRTLRRLSADGLVEEAAARPDPALDDQRRRYFRITAEGIAAVRAEVDRLERVVTQARAHDALTG